nr:MAG TPA: hypothetical protein [Caudoviricetes sp.]
MKRGDKKETMKVVQLAGNGYLYIIIDSPNGRINQR